MRSNTGVVHNQTSAPSGGSAAPGGAEDWD